MDWVTNLSLVPILHSLRVRLLLFALIVATLTGWIAVIFASSSITNRFNSYLTQEQTQFIENAPIAEGAISDLLVQLYDSETGWSDNTPQILNNLSHLIGYDLAISDEGGQIMVDTTSIADSPVQEDHTPEIIVDGQVVGSLSVNLPAPSYSANEDSFRQSIVRSVLLSVIVTGSISTVLLLVMAHPLLSTLEALTSAAKKVTENELKQRVPVRSQDEIGQLAKVFNQMADKLAHTEQLRKNMVTDIAHELRTPLSNLRGYMEALRDERIEPSIDLFDALHEQALTLNRLVDDLQELSLADTGHLQLNREAIAVQPLVERAVRFMQQAAKDAKVSINLDISDNMPTLFADVDRISQILINLLRNAVQYTLPNGQIDLKAYSDSERITIKIHNSGEGIPAEHLSYIFERFYRVDPSRTRATGGSGLGLAIVKQLIEAHDGTITVDSQLGQGATFTLTFPVTLA